MIQKISNVLQRHLMGKCVNFSNLRPFSSSKTMSQNTSQSVNVINRNDGTVIVEMNNKPVNVLHYDFMKQLTGVLRQLNGQCTGLILTSCANTFCAGADINEFYDTKHFDYMKVLEELWFSIYDISVPTIAAINGVAIAGGAFIANACDYRFMTKNGKIGLNEVSVGVPLPFSVYKSAVLILGEKMGNRVSLEGTLFNANDALTMGWIDAVADDNDQLMEMSVNKLQHLKDTVLLTAYSEIKRLSQRSFRDEYSKHGEESVQKFIDHLSKDDTHEYIGNVMKALKSKKK